MTVYPSILPSFKWIRFPDNPGISAGLFFILTSILTFGGINMAASLKEAMSGNALLTAIMYLLIGIVMLAFGNGSIKFIFWISGVVMIVVGILQIVLKSTDVKGGLITIIVGIILIIIGAFDSIAKILVGLILIFSALPALGAATGSIAEKFGMGTIDSGSATLNKIIAAVLLIVGVCLIIGLVADVADNIADILIRLGGLILLVLGLVNLIKALK